MAINRYIILRGGGESQFFVLEEEIFEVCLGFEDGFFFAVDLAEEGVELLLGQFVAFFAQLDHLYDTFHRYGYHSNKYI